jgi:hypothetical protein
MEMQEYKKIVIFVVDIFIQGKELDLFLDRLVVQIKLKY